MNLYREASGLWDTDYYQCLPLLILAEEDKAYFYVFGVLYQMHRLGLYPQRPLFYDSWTILWWNLWEKKYRPEAELESRILQKAFADETLYMIFHSPRFFEIYEQAKNRLKLGVRHDESP